MKGKVSKTGYRDDSKDKGNEFNFIPSNRISMKNVSEPIMLFPHSSVNGFGNPVLAHPDEEHHFPNHSGVLEIPMRHLQMGGGDTGNYERSDSGVIPRTLYNDAVFHELNKKRDFGSAESENLRMFKSRQKQNGFLHELKEYSKFANKERQLQDGGETNTFDGGLSPEEARAALIQGHIMGNVLSDLQRTRFAEIAGTNEDGELLDENGDIVDETNQDNTDEEQMRYGGQRKLHRNGYTSKNIKSSINELFLRNYNAYGKSGKHIYNPKAEEGGEWLDKYQEGGQNNGSTGGSKNIHVPTAFEMLPKWKQDVIRNQPHSTQAQLSPAKPMSAEDIARSESISRKLEHPWIYNPAATLASYATRLQPMSEEDVIKTHGNPAEATKWATGVFQDALVNEMAPTVIGKGASALKKAGKEAIYKGINPVGYGAKQKALDFIPNLIKYSVNPEEKILDIAAGFEKHPESFKKAVKELSGSANPNATTLEKMSEMSPSQTERIKKTLEMGKNRSDAFRTALGLPQEHNTFINIGEGKHKINPEKFKPTPADFSRLHNDIQAHEISKMGAYFGDNPLVGLTENYNKISSPKIQTKYGDVSINDIRKYIMKEGDKTPAWKQSRIVEKSKNPEFTHSIYDTDNNGIMGSFRWDVGKTPEGNLHFQANDKWDLHPWENRGAVKVKEDALDKKILSEHYKKPLAKVEALKLLSGKPFDIRNNFIVDPKTYKVLKAFKTGGETNWLEKY